MKNIHVLPTDKPSRLHLWYDGEKPSLETCELEYSHTRNTQHIYITSDGEIKKGDWYYLPRTNSVHKCIEDPTELNLERRLGVTKIILTTDLDLIEDGVQAIDDEFLEWFVKNPTCEYIPTPIIELCENCGQQFCDNGDCRGWGDKSYYLLAYPESISEKTITYCDGYEVNIKEVPQEEPKLTKCYCGHTTYCDCGPQEITEKTFTSNEENPVNIHIKVLPEFDSVSKQETLEEAAKEYAENAIGSVGDDDDKYSCSQDFIAGANWQAERMYTEKEVLQMFHDFRNTFELHRNIQILPDMFFGWFEKYKK